MAQIANIKVKFADNSVKELRTKNIFSIRLTIDGLHIIYWNNYSVSSSEDIRTFLEMPKKKHL